ncbi:acetyl-CoA synthetase-like protein [Marasmius fiardii PR-910]|nr:acetyl-CoA synthetase-like protein [Marasmius fiardii PR-910]
MLFPPVSISTSAIRGWRIPLPPQTQAKSSSTFTPPPMDGSMCLTQVYDWQAHHSPNHRLFLFSNREGKVRTILWKEAIAAIYTGARLIRTRLAHNLSDKNKPLIVAIVTTTDTLVYFTMIMSLLRADCVVFPISPRNSAAAVAHLLEKVGADHVLVGLEAAMQELVHEALKLFKTQFPSQQLPSFSPVFSFEDLFRPDWEGSVTLQPDELPLKLVNLHDTVLYLHSSGSTAFPKPIPVTNLRFLQFGQIPWFGEQDWNDKVLSMHVVPMIHGMAVMQTFWAASTGLVIATFEPKLPPIPPTPENVYEAARFTSTDVILCAPSFVEAWACHPKYVEWLSGRAGIIYGGGPLTREVGDYMTSQGVSIFILYGMTEVSILTPMIPAKAEKNKDWNYFRFSDLVKCHWKPYGGDMYELIILENPHCTPGVFNTEVDGARAYATSDLFIPHPTKLGYWRIHGRADDQIVHSMGEKTNPVPLEQILNQDPHVEAAVMFGHGRFNAGVLVQPKAPFRFDPTDDRKLAEFCDMIWPTIEQMNGYAPQHSRLFKEMILVASPVKPFTYTAKGTARRQAVLLDYSEEISTLYDILDENTRSNVAPPTDWDMGSTTTFVRAVVGSILVHSVQDDDDIFEYGCDSLQATWIRNTILCALRDLANLDHRSITRNFVYDYPTTDQLSIFVFSLAAGGAVPEQLDESEKKNLMSDLVEEYTKDFPVRLQQPKLTSTESEKVVLLTGSTGNLGSYVLSSMIEDSTVTHVYALIRKGTVDILQRQRAAFESRGLNAKTVLAEKVTILECDLCQDRLGIDSSLSSKVLGSITDVVDIAWRVDFNLSLSSFRTNLKGMRNLVNVAIERDAHYMFASSIGVCRNITNGREEFVAAEGALGIGYTESKWVAEQVIRAAASSTGLRTSIVRIGQLTGGRNGAWSTKEWLPSLVQASSFLRLVPEDGRIVSWIPLHIAGEIMVDFLNSSAGAETPQILHLLHPRPVPWTKLAQSLATKLEATLVPYENWLHALEMATNHIGPKKLNAFTLLLFFKSVLETVNETNKEAFGFAKLSIDQAQRRSRYLRGEEMRDLGEEDVVLWTKYWKREGIL